MLDTARVGSSDFSEGVHTLKLRAEGDTITVTIDETIELAARDSCAFLYGNLGVYAGNGDITVHAFTYRAI